MVSVVTAQQQLAAVGAADGRVPTMVTAAQQTQIKRAINLHLREQGVFASLKAIVSSVLRGVEGGEEAAPSHSGGDAVAAAQQCSVLARIVAEEAGAHLSPPPAGDGTGRGPLVHVLLLGGRAFSHPDAEAGAAGGDEGGGAAIDHAARGTVCVCMHFGAQRFRSKSVPLCAEPQLHDGVLLEMPPPDAVATAAMAASPLPAGASVERLRGLLRAEPIHVVVLHRPADGAAEVVLSSTMLEWRPVLHQGKMTLSLELHGLGAEATLPVGCLELKLELLPRPRPEASLTEAEVLGELRRQRDAQVPRASPPRAVPPSPSRPTSPSPSPSPSLASRPIRPPTPLLPLPSVPPPPNAGVACGGAIAHADAPSCRASCACARG